MLILFLPGWGFCSGIFSLLSQGVCTGYRYRCYDYPGYMYKSALAYPDNMMDLIDDIIQFCGANERIIIIGWSFGGALGMLVAHLYPQRVMGVITLASSPVYDRKGEAGVRTTKTFDWLASTLRSKPKIAMKRYLSWQLHNHDSANLKILSKNICHNNDVLINSLVHVRHIDIRNRPVVCRTDHIVALHDRIVPAPLQSIPRSQQGKEHVYTLYGGHCIFLDAACKTTAIIESILAQYAYGS